MIEQHAFGAIEQEPKTSDILLGSVTPTAGTPATYFPLDYQLVIESQHQEPACGSHAGNEMAEIFNVMQTGKFKRLSPMYLWKRIKQMDGFSPTDGTSMEYIFKALQKYGTCEYDLMGNDSLLPLDQYTSAGNITPTMDANAQNYRIGTYAFQWSPTFQQVKDAIYTHKVVIGLLRVGAEWWTDKNGVSSWAEKDILPLQTKYAISSGHFITFYAYDENYVYFYNHWSDTWGRQGIGYFASDYANRVLQIGTAVDLTSTIFSAVLKQGSKGSDVSVLQKRLTDLGYSTHGVDGIFGSNTKKAVQAFQSANGLEPDGIVGKLTNAKL